MTLHKRIAKVRNDVLNLAGESLRANDQIRSEALFDIAVRLQALIPLDDVDDHNATVVEEKSQPTSQVTPSQTKNEGMIYKTRTLRQRAMTSSFTRIFAMRKGETYEAELDTRRISSGGQGACVRFRGDWITASKAANSITGTQVNGWQNFWRYHRSDGTNGPIQELREQELRSRLHQSDAYHSVRR